MLRGRLARVILLAISPRRVSQQKDSIRNEPPTAAGVDCVPIPAEDRVAISNYAILQSAISLLIIIVSLGFLAFVMFFRTSKHLAPAGASGKTSSSAVKPVPKHVPLSGEANSSVRSLGQRDPQGFLIPDHRNLVMLASAARIQEPGQSDPNKPPPIAAPKKNPANPPATTELPPPLKPPAAPVPEPSNSASASTPPTSGSSTSAGPMPATGTEATAPKAAPKNEATAETKSTDKGADTKGGSTAGVTSGATGSNKPPATQPAATQPAAPASGNGNSTIKELATFFQGKLTPIFEGGVFASYSVEALRTESTGSTNIRFTDGLSQASRERTVDSHFGIGQRAVLGIRGSLVGYRASYQHLLEETSRFDRPDFRYLWPDLSSMSRIDLNVADIELTQKHCINDIYIESFFGVRYAEYRGADMAVGVGKIAQTLEAHAIAHSYRETEGIGPTFGLSAKRHLPWKFGCGMFDSCGDQDCGNLGWSWFWTLRGAVLRSRVLSSAYTESQLGIYSNETGVQGVARSADKSYLDQTTEQNLFNGEFQIGVEYCRPLVFIPATASLRTSLVCQYWDTGPGVSSSQSYASLSGKTPDFSGRVDSFAISDNRYLNLFGVNLTMGLNY